MRLISLIAVSVALLSTTAVAQDSAQLTFSPARVVLDGEQIVDSPESNPLNPGDVVLAGKRGIGLFSLSTHAFSGSSECGSLADRTISCTFDDHNVEIKSHTRLLRNDGAPVPIYGRIDPYEPRPGHMQQTFVAVVSLDAHAAMMGRKL